MAIGYNGSRLMTLLSPPLAGRSIEVKLASRKWRQLQDKISQNPQDLTESIDLDAAIHGVAFASKKNTRELPAKSSDDSKKASQREVPMPVLSGILRNTDIHGRTYITAVIDGHRLRENDSVRGFQINKIQADGVVVASGGRKWFLSAPNVAYSRIHASAADDKSSQ